MDTRTQQLLIGKGVIDTDRVTARPSTRHCKTCRRVVLVALADDGPGVAGTRVTLDPRRVSPKGELDALTAGLATFAHHGGGITWRDPVSISRADASTKKVHHEHACHSPPVEYQDTKKTAQEIDPTYSTIPF